MVMVGDKMFRQEDLQEQEPPLADCPSIVFNNNKYTQSYTTESIVLLIHAYCTYRLLPLPFLHLDI